MKHYEYFNTLLPHLTAEHEGPVASVITPSAAFGYASAQEAEAIFAGEEPKPVYARMGNPTGTKLEQALAKMEGGAGAVATSSGMGAVAMVLTAFLQSGDRVVCAGGLFGGSYAMMSDTMPRFGIVTEFFDVDDFDTIEASLSSGAKMLFVESVGNPNLRLPDIRRLAILCERYEALFVVDNTLTPLIVQPLKMGADIVVYSTTKIVSGHSAALGGAAVFRGVKEEGEKLAGERFVQLHPFLKKGRAAMVMMAKKRAMRDFGMSANAFGSFLTMLGLETLALRTQRVNSTVQKTAQLLYDEGVKVRHPSLQNHEHNFRYEALFEDGCGPLLTIDFDTKTEAFSFLNALKIPVQTANIGDNRTLALHMASTIYRDFDEESLRLMGITPGLVRFSIGLEAPVALAEDIVAAWKKRR